MNGRQENDRKIENSILDTLKDTYDILSDYYYSLSDKTPATKRQYIQRNIRFLKHIEYNDDIKVFKSIRPSDINKYMAEIKYDEEGNERSVSARAGILFAISNFFNFLVIEGYVSENVCDKVNPPKITQEKDVVAMTPDEVREVEGNIRRWAKRKWRSRDLALFMLGCATGLRVSSIQEINVSDIDLDNNKITVTEKGNKVRTCFISDEIKRYIQDWIEDRKEILGNVDIDALFISNRLSRISTNTIRNNIEYYTSSLDKKITPHKMRSTCATNLYEATGDIFLVQNLLGHKNITNTRRYAKMSEKKLSEAADVLGKMYGGGI